MPEAAGPDATGLPEGYGQGNGVSARIADFIVRTRWLWVIAALAMLAVSAARLDQVVPIDPDARIFFAPENPDRQRLDQFEEMFSKDDNLMILVEPAGGEVFTPETLRYIGEFTEEAWLLPFVRRVNSLTNFQHTYAEGDEMIVRVHSECLTGEAFGSLKCECGPQLDAALDTIQREGGAVLYLRGHEGRGIGLINKLRAYRLQEEGYDTLDANLALGLPADSRDYEAAGDMLHDLGVNRIRLLSNNPEKQRQLVQYGIEVSELVPLVVGVGTDNEGYLGAKRDRMGHRLPETITSAPVLSTLEGTTP